MFDKKYFSERVKAKRWRERTSLREVSIETGVSAPTLSRMENENLPDIETFAKLCKWMKVNPGKFFK